ncbi:MAG: hypothetical protein ABW104_05585 [Candidatus Thiodiazotropha sp. 6PLUC2]
MISWLVIVVGLYLSWNFTELESASSLQNTLCPILVFLFLIALLVKIVFLMGPSSGRDVGSGGGGFFGGDGGGGDCGGGGE